MKKNEELNQKYCFYVACGMAVAMLAGIFLERIFQTEITSVIKPCPFQQMTGLYCFGCGGTRAVRELLRGSFVKCFLYHPFVAYAAAVHLLFFVLYLRRILFHKSNFVMILRPIHFYIGIGIIIVQWIIKNGIVILLCR